MIVLCLIIAAASIAASAIIYSISKKQQNSLKRVLTAVGAMLFLSLGLELSLFNINYYTSFGNNEISLNSYLTDYADCDGNYAVNSAGATVEFTEISEKVHNIYIDLKSSGNPESVPVTVSLTDSANAYYFTSPERTLYTSSEKSQYLNVNTSGATENMALTFNLESNEILNINGIYINCNRPFNFSVVRLLIMLSVLCFIYMFMPSSVLYKISVTEKETRNSLVLSALCVQCAVIIILGTINPTFMGIASKNYNSYNWKQSGINSFSLNMKNHNQYDELATAVLDGKTYIDNDDIPDSLAEMKNPYDSVARSYKAAQTGDVYRWDVAYYNNHYYVYFGIVPLLLMYLPCRAIFNAPFPTAVGIMIFSLLFSIGVYKLLLLLAQKKFKNISVGTFILTAVTFINCCGAMFLAKRPDFYSIPIITGMTFTVFGLYNWLCGLNGDKHVILRFFAGSLCMALVAGCRPQLILVSFLAIPLFFKKFITDKELLKRSGIHELAVLGAPYIVVAAGIMYYNFIRFGSPIDFGSSYNLTTNDVTKRGFSFGRIGLGLFTYLFQTPKFTAEFPYLQKATISTSYIGKTIYENCFGGLITSLPFLWFIAAFGKVRDKLREKKLFLFTLFTLIIGFALVIADTEAGGLLQRYYSDFGFVFFLAAALIIFALFEKCETVRERSIFKTLVFFASILSIFYSVALAFSVSDVTIDTQNTTLFAFLSSIVEFWL